MRDLPDIVAPSHTNCAPMSESLYAIMLYLGLHPLEPKWQGGGIFISVIEGCQDVVSEGWGDGVGCASTSRCQIYLGWGKVS